MSGTTVGLLIFAGMLALMVIRVPIAAAMFIPGALGYWALSNSNGLINLLKGSSVARLTVYDLSVIPLFLLMGNFATQGGLSRDLFKAASALVGHVRGGMAMASILSAAAFGAVCGSSVATTATITQVAYPQMKKLGYSGRLATGTLATGGTLGILIPPSVPLVVYAILTEQNISKLFAAAIVPGILAMLGYCAVVYLMVRKNPELAPPAQRATGKEQVSALLQIWPIVGIFIAVFGGIYGGVFSPTEGAGVGALLTFILGLAKRKLSLSAVQLALTSTAETTAMVFMIFLGADMMNAALALTQMPASIADWVTHLAVPPIVVLSVVLITYIVLGCVMDELSMLLLTIPVIFPALIGLEFFGLAKEPKAIWFGILILMTVGIGMLAPPVGMNVYVVNNIAKEVPMRETYAGVMPFIVWDLIRLLLVLMFPIICLAAIKILFK